MVTVDDGRIPFRFCDSVPTGWQSRVGWPQDGEGFGEQLCLLLVCHLDLGIDLLAVGGDEGVVLRVGALQHPRVCVHVFVLQRPLIHAPHPGDPLPSDGSGDGKKEVFQQSAVPIPEVFPLAERFVGFIRLTGREVRDIGRLLAEVQCLAGPHPAVVSVFDNARRFQAFFHLLVWWMITVPNRSRRIHCLHLQTRPVFSLSALGT